MSTQRRENHSTPSTKIYRRGPRNWQRKNCTDVVKGADQIWLALIAWFARAMARVGTAPPDKSARLATNSLQMGHRNTQLVRLHHRRAPHNPPPNWAARHATTGTPATRRSSLPLTPTPSVLERLHPSLPKIPAGKCRWTERYDGKRDLYFQYAA